MTKENKKRETKKGIILVLALAFAFIFIAGFASAWVCGDGIIQNPDSSGIHEQCDDGNTVNYDGCSSNCTIETPCNLQLTKSTSKQTAKPNDTVTYTLKYKNIGGTTCTGGGVEIQDALSSSLSYMGSFTKNTTNDLDNDGIDAAWYSTPGYDALTNTLTWNVHRVSPGEEGTITFNVKVLTPTHCGDFQIPNFFKAWSNQENWKSSNTVNLNVDYNCPVCGDHIINQANETCDDGNLINNDGCSSTCKIENCGDNICNNGETCSTCSADCGVCAPVCGNGIKEAGEDCDKGALNGQVCSPLYGSSCTYCSSLCKNITIPGGYCGDGIKQANEQCDDHNTVNGDGCSSTCKTEYCGDGIKQANEQCDDGNTANNDGCSSTCKIENCGDNICNNGETCSTCPCDCGTCAPQPKCGDGIINQANETCDKGVLNGNVCSPLYGSSCTYCSNSCNNVTIPGGYCGDGIKQANEQCDDHNIINDDGCSSTCKTEYCGDGIKQANEQCDDHNTVNGDGCSSTCKIESCGDNICNNGETCSTCPCDCGVCAPVCGNGIKEAGEDCDKGTLNGQVCSPLYGSSCTYCSSLCKNITLTDGYCGDGILQSGEECDDHNNVSGDGCSSDCKIEFSSCKYNVSVRYSYANSFGTGIAINNSLNYMWVSETPAHLNQGIHKIRYYVDNNIANKTNNASITVKLDNTNIISYYQVISTAHYKTLSLDTSNLQCDSLHNITVEVKSESNGICTNDSTSDNYANRTIYIDCGEQNYCGDGSLGSGEECDLGANNGVMCTPAYGGLCTYCSSKCEEIVLTDGYCGDGIVQSPQEQCDDGNLDNEDGCSSTCQTEEQKFCIEDISIRKSYANSFGTGIALGFNNGTWISQISPDLVKGGYEIRYYVDNNVANTTNNAHITVKLDGSILSNYNYIISKYHSKTLTINTTGLECNSMHKISVKADSEQSLICTADNTSDNYAERSFFVVCEEPQCGDGNLDNGEECDDGNTDNGDGCSANCTIENCGDGVCNNGETCSTCPCDCGICAPVCGNGIKEASEDCDKGVLNGNVCSPLYGSSCNYCSSQCKNITLTDGHCGDSVVQSQYEQCDKGSLNGNVCTPLYGSSCTYCSSICQNITLTDGHCGDSVVQSQYEECDNGALNGNVCTPLYGNSCSYCSSSCNNVTIPGGHCGDGIKQANEQCDDGNTVNTDGCRNNCVLPVCGDSIKDINEQCDLGILNGNVCTPLYGSSCSYCSSQCNNITIPGGHCGDGITQANEQCDDGNTVNTDGCRNNCVLPVCGDSIKDANEQCDLGALNGNVCTPLYGSSCSYCSSSCNNVTIPGGHCGDGITQANEQCDDGNLLNNDGCSSTCKTEYCGDGIKQANEGCDDGNNVNGDGCSSTCKIEKCGDSIKQSNEQCDLGILNGNVCTPLYGSSCSYCSSSCTNITIPGGHCGDGIKQANEQCDDGNTVNTDGCRNNCKIPYCGDGIKDKNEYCDDGNNVNGDGCSATCRFECPNGICTPNVTIEKFPPQVWQCGDHRIVMDDGTEPGRISEDGQTLVERINNYAFEGEQIQWKVLVLDKNGIEKIRDVYSTVNGNIEANCHLDNILSATTPIESDCNAKIGEEKLLTPGYDNVAAYYTCTLSVETPESMHGQSDITVEALDNDGITGKMAEIESWFLNPVVSLGVQGSVTFDSQRPGTSEYSSPVILTNNADIGSGVLLDTFVSGTDFYDSSKSGAKCPNTNQLKLSNFAYYATNGAYSTAQDLQVGRTCDSEGYCHVNYGIGFNNPNPFYNKNEVIQAQKVGLYYTANLLAPGADMSLIFRLNVPEPCNGNFNSGHIYFWGEAV